MTPQQLLQRFRRDVDDVKVDEFEDDLLFTDDEIYDYMDEAHNRLVVETRYYHRVFELPVTAGQSSIFLPSAFVESRGETAFLQDARTPVYERSLSELSVPSDDYGALITGSMFQQNYQARPRVYTADAAANQLTLWPTPLEDDTLLLPAFSAPPLITGPDDTFCLNNRKHIRALLPGMKALAYAKQDADSYDPRQAERWELEFRERILEIGSERMRRRRKPQVVAYGGL